MNEKNVSQEWEMKAIELANGKSVLEAAKDAKEIYTLDLKTEISAIESAISKAEMEERKAKLNYENSAYTIFGGESAFKNYITHRDNLYNRQKEIEENVKFLKEALTYRKGQLENLTGAK